MRLACFGDLFIWFESDRGQETTSHSGIENVQDCTTAGEGFVPPRLTGPYGLSVVAFEDRIVRSSSVTVVFAMLIGVLWKKGLSCLLGIVKVTARASW